MSLDFDTEKTTNQNIDDLRRREAEELAQILSTRYGFPYIDLSRVPINTSVIRLISEENAREARAVAYNLEHNILSVGIQTPNNPSVPALMTELERQGYTVSFAIVSEFSLEKAWEIYKEVSYAKAEVRGVIAISDDTMKEYVGQVKTTADVKPLIEKATNSDDQHILSSVVEIIMGSAVAVGASDVHLEPEEDVVRVRYRLDGVLQDVAALPHIAFKKVLARIKLLAGMKLNIVKQAQDGRFTIDINGVSIEVRTSILPAAYQESIVMRLLNPKSISVPMEALGMDDHLYPIMEREISKPNGLILTTGPTGSGKTTTLYAILNKIKGPEVKVITIEDPVEYKLSGIQQTPVDHKRGVTFANGLRAAVRQDPDVIMVGEIRDEETAAIAIDSALTGHLVFSTLHTNNAAGAIPRLIDLGVNPKIISSALNIALAQRLVRKLCVHCKVEYPVEGTEKEVLEREIPKIAPYRPGTVVPEKIWKAAGCDQCGFTGFKGRISVYEGILMDKAVEEVIRANPSERDIREAAAPQGILEMHQDGIMKVLAGITSMEEVERSVGFGGLR